MVGKNPHRPEGKAADTEHMADRYASRGAPRQAPSKKEIEDRNLEEKDRHGGPAVIPEEHQVGGSRPGVPSRVKAALEERAEREE